MSNENRFSGLMGGLADSSSEQPKEKPKTESKSSAKKTEKRKKPMPKSKDPDYSQIGLYLPNALHKRMKIAAAMTELEISEIAAQAIGEWLEKKGINV